MVENKQIADDESQSETLFSKTIPKMNKAGNRQVGSMTIELKTYEGSMFVQLNQVKYAFGKIPEKRSWVTFNPNDAEIKEAIVEAYKKAK